MLEQVKDLLFDFQIEGWICLDFIDSLPVVSGIEQAIITEFEKLTEIAIDLVVVLWVNLRSVFQSYCLCCPFSHLVKFAFYHVVGKVLFVEQVPNWLLPLLSCHSQQILERLLDDSGHNWIVANIGVIQLKIVLLFARLQIFLEAEFIECFQDQLILLIADWAKYGLIVSVKFVDVTFSIDWYRFSRV